MIMTMRWWPVAAAAMLAGCSGTPELAVDGAWMRMPAVAGRPGVVYFTIHGGAAPARLIAVSSAWAIRVDLHESMSGPGSGRGGMMAMTPLRDVAIPAKSDVVFAPGGKHGMVCGINPAVRIGETMTFTFTFADGRRIRRIARVYAAGDAGPQ